MHRSFRKGSSSGTTAQIASTRGLPPKIGMSRAAERPSLRGSGLEFDRGRSVGELEPDDAADEADKE